jgi:hypothetical protein
MRSEEEILARAKELSKDRMYIAGTHAGWLKSEIYNMINDLRIEELMWVLELGKESKQ